MLLKTLPAALLLLFFLVVSFLGTEGAHAMQKHVSSACEQASALASEQACHAELSAHHHVPYSPHGQHSDCDDCDTCINCVCHAPLTVEPFKLGYNPTMLNMITSDPFRRLPEVYLSWFIPPKS